MNNRFIVYSKPGCPSCVNAKQLIAVSGDVYVENVIGKDITREEFVEMYPDVRSVPHIVNEGSVIGGYDKLVEWYNER